MTTSYACAMSVASDVSPHSTGKERDTESGLDYFGARYYASNMGRFMSPDPIKVSAAHLMNPQNWNKYSYVLNNPLTGVDPDGQFPIFVFRPTVGSKGFGTTREWNAAKANAARHGNQMTVYSGASANADNMKAALATPDARVVFDGHSNYVNDPSSAGSITTGAIQLSGSSMGDPTIVGGAVAVPDNIQAPVVGIFACDSQAVSAQYGDAVTTSLNSGADKETSIEATSGAALAYANAIGSNQTPDAATTAASRSLANSTNPHDAGDSAVIRKLPDPKKPTL